MQPLVHKPTILSLVPPWRETMFGYAARMARFIRAGDGSFRAPNCTVVGDVTIGENSSIWFGAVIRGDVAAVIVGRRVNIQDNAVVHCDSGVLNELQDDVTVGHGAIVHGKFVGRGSLIGMGSTLLSRTIIGRECLVAAGAVVPPDLNVPDGMLVMGVPGKIVRPVKPEELEYMRWLTTHYQELAEQYAAGKFDQKSV
jgi:carbonic anhydrase/acetyltransferase-like protein (isoleucine patch superfamily)